MILCGDLGGTKALLGVAEIAAGGPRMVFERRYACADFEDFPGLWTAFRKDAAAFSGRLDGACLAVAGPVADDGRSARLTNLPWTVDAEAAAASFGLSSLRLLNDFAAASLGTTVADPAASLVIQAGRPLAAAPRLVVGAGTGLGMAVLLPEPGGWRVVPGEGGHVGFAPADELQGALWQWLSARHGRVTAERVVSGSGLALIYEFLATRHAADMPDPLADPHPQAAIGALAIARPDSLARRAVGLFLACYGSFAGDMALAVLARGGVCLAGGIIGRLASLVADGDFLASFTAKAEHRDLALAMPVTAMTDPALGLKGAALGAIDNCQRDRNTVGL